MAQNDERNDLFNDGRVRIRKNHCNEVFITDIVTGVEMRLSSNGRGLGFTTFGGGRVQPTVVAGSVGWEVVPR